jgi:hypothetical protein
MKVVASEVTAQQFRLVHSGRCEVASSIIIKLARKIAPRRKKLTPLGRDAVYA